MEGEKGNKNAYFFLRHLYDIFFSHDFHKYLMTFSSTSSRKKIERGKEKGGRREGLSSSYL